MVLLTLAPLPGLQWGLAGQEGPCSAQSDHSWSSPSQGWGGCSRPTTHRGTCVALSMQELSAVVWVCQGFGARLVLGGLEVSPNFYIGFRGLAGLGLCAGALEVVCNPGSHLGSRHPSELWSRAGAGASPCGCWWWVQDTSLFSWVLPNCPLGLHIPERSDVLIGGYLLHFQALQQERG